MVLSIIKSKVILTCHIYIYFFLKEVRRSGTDFQIFRTLSDCCQKALFHKYSLQHISEAPLSFASPQYQHFENIEALGTVSRII